VLRAKAWTFVFLLVLNSRAFLLKMQCAQRDEMHLFQMEELQQHPLSPSLGEVL
jgi:hypothetical protein